MTSMTEPAEVLERLDRLSLQVEGIAEQVRQQQMAREKWSELAQTLAPVTRGAMDVATRELTELGPEVTAEDAARFARTLARSLPRLELLLAQLESISELLQEANSLSGAAMAALTDAMAAADEKGYFAFVRASAGIADNVVTQFTEDDVRALGDNIVTILNAVKEMTQPEVMAMVQRTAITIQDVEDRHTEPPSVFALVKSMREPQTRRGLARLLAMLHTMGEENPPAGRPGN